MKIAILSMIYFESDWHQTAECLSYTGLPIYFANRYGIGGLSMAFNKAFIYNDLVNRYDYVWFVTNIVFHDIRLPQKLASLMDHKTAAIHPAFESDHPHLRSRPELGDTTNVPFVEFTAPMVSAKAFAQLPLDEEMPYTGHDLDWGYRARCLGFNLKTANRLLIEHVYNRHLERKQHPITLKRALMRREEEPKTLASLEKKWGAGWREKLKYFGTI